MEKNERRPVAEPIPGDTAAAPVEGVRQRSHRASTVAAAYDIPRSHFGRAETRAPRIHTRNSARPNETRFALGLAAQDIARMDADGNPVRELGVVG